MKSALYDWFRQTAASRPHAPAITFLRGDGGSVSYSYERLFSRVREIGLDLKSHYQDRSAPLGLLMTSQEAQVLHYLAGLDAGVVPAILTPPNRKLNSDYYLETMTKVLGRCRFGAVVSDVEGIELPTRGLQPYTFTPISGSNSAGIQDAEGSELDASFMQFSSGTTGIKRGVLVGDEAVIAQLETYGEALRLDQGDVIVSWLPLYHDMGFIACLNMPLAFGVHTVMIDPIDWVSNPSTYLKAVSDYRGTLSWHPNFAFAFMAQRVRESDLEGVDLSSLRGLVNCSEPVTYESQQAFSERYASRGLSKGVFKGCYAMAETTFALTHGEPSDPGHLDPVGPSDGTRSVSTAGYVSVGQPLPGVEMTIRDPDTLAEVPERAIGEIWVRSPFNFDGYYNEPEATGEAFADDWYRTGDLGYRAGNALYVAGRLKDLLIVGGVNVFPQDIEDLVSDVDGVVPGRVSAFSTFDERRQTEHVIVLAETSQQQDRDRQQTTLKIRQEILAAFQIANFEVRLVDPGWLVKSTSGKMARGQNRRKWLGQRTVESSRDEARAQRDTG